MSKAVKSLLSLIILTSPIGAAYADLTIDMNQYYLSPGVGGNPGDLNVVPANNQLQSTNMPWMTATFSQIDTSHISLTMTAVNLSPGEKAANWAFSFAPAAGDVYNLQIDQINPEEGGPTGYGFTNKLVDDPYYDYDLIFNFNVGIAPNQSISFMLTGNEDLAGNLSLADFMGVSSVTGFTSRAGVVTPNGFFGSTPIVGLASAVAAPEPTTYAMLAGMLILVACLSRRRSTVC